MRRDTPIYDFTMNMKKKKNPLMRPDLNILFACYTFNTYLLLLIKGARDIVRIISKKWANKVEKQLSTKTFSM